MLRLTYISILDDKKRFRKTSNIFQGRNIYAELTTRTYWYIDNLHTGKASHFEVFDKHGKHTAFCVFKTYNNSSGQNNCGDEQMRPDI